MTARTGNARGRASLMPARIGWLLAAFAAVCAVVDTAMTAAYRPLLSEQSVAVHGWPLTTAASLGSAVMGALIVSRYPKHPIGWLLSGLGTTSSFSMVTEAYSLWVINGNGPGPTSAAHLAAWISAFFGGALALSGLTVMFLISPDGRFLSRRWRYVALAAVTGLLLWLSGLFLTPPSKIVVGDNSYSPGTVVLLLLNVGFVLIGLALAGSAVSLVLRLRRADGDLRQQLRWIAAAATALPVGIIVMVVVQMTNGGRQSWLASVPLFAAYLALPICTAVAVLRYRLYDIDLIINRAVVLACGTAFAATGYVALVVGIGTLVGANTRGFWPSLLATAVIALAFQPIRRWVVRIAGRLAYGARAAPYEALADFSRRLGDSPDPQLLLPAVARATAQAVGASRTIVRLHLGQGADRFAGWPTDSSGEGEVDSTADLEVPVTDRGDHLGLIEVRMPPGRALRTTDRAILADVAKQTALAFRNARLAMELDAQVELLDRRTAELAASRTRIIDARDKEQVRLERAIHRDVVRHLEHIPSRLDALRHDPGQGAPARAVGELIEDVTRALEALRDLTRGIYSTQLTRSGLGSAMTARAAASIGADSVTVDDSASARRFDPRLESAAYFCFVSAAAEMRPPVTVHLGVDDDVLRLVIAGGTASTIDLAHLRDRIDPLGGAAVCIRAVGRMVLTITLPVEIAELPAARTVPGSLDRPSRVYARR